MRSISLIVITAYLVHASPDERCFVLSRSPAGPDEASSQCAIKAFEGSDICQRFVPGRRLGARCVPSEDPMTYSCVCGSHDCPTTSPEVKAMYEKHLHRYKILSPDRKRHPLHDCVNDATVQFQDADTPKSSSKPTIPDAPTTPSSEENLSTSPPSSSSAEPESSPSDQNTAEEASTTEEPLRSTSSSTTVSEPRTEDEGSDEITTSPRYKSTRIVDNTYSTASYSTMSTGTAPEFEGKATDYTWIYVVVSLILAMVALSTIGGGLYCKLRKKPIVAAKPKVAKKANQKLAEGTVATPAEVRIEIPAERPSIPVKDTAPPLPDTPPINQSLTGTTGPMGSPNEDDLNTAGSTITECEISISTTMTEETTGGSGTSGL